MTESQYWKWRHKASEMHLAETRLENVQLQSKISQLEYAHKINAFRIKVDNSKQDYFQCLENIEKTLGVTLKNKIIDDETLEIKEAPEDKQ